MKAAIGALIVAASVFSVPMPAVAAGSFDDSQKAEIGAVVRDYLLKHPEILRDMSGALQKIEQEQQGIAAKQSIKENAQGIFRSSADLVLGNPNGKVTVVEFFDYNCGFCKRALPDVKALIAGDKDVKVVMKEFPILGESSMLASKLAIASQRQGKYPQFHDALISAPGHLDDARIMSIAKTVGLDTDRLVKDGNSPEIAALIRDNNQMAGRLGINGTPAFIIGQNLTPGAVGLDELKSQVDRVRSEGCAVC